MHTSSKRPLVERGWRYTIVGAICALANYIIMLVVDFAGGHYLLGTVISFLIVTPLGYVLHSWFTFAETLRFKAFMRFTASIAFTFPVAVALMIVLCSGFGLTVAIATPVATGILFLWNFAAAHWAILPRFDLRSVFVSAGPSSEPTHQLAGKAE
jgi:putative flippase GtrA